MPLNVNRPIHRGVFTQECPRRVATGLETLRGNFWNKIVLLMA